MSQQGHIESSRIVVHWIQSTRLWQGCEQFLLCRRHVSLIKERNILGLFWDLPVLIEWYPRGQTLMPNQAFNVGFIDLNNLHPWALANQFCDDSLVFDRVDGTGRIGHHATRSKQLRSSGSNVNLQLEHGSSTFW